MAPHSVGPEPEELSRAISELDLTSLRNVDGGFDEVDGVEPGKGPHYTRDQLLSIRPESSEFDIKIKVPEIANGVNTPPGPPKVPPPTPEHLSVTPASGNSTPAARLPTTLEEPEDEEGAAADGSGAQDNNRNDQEVTEEPKKKKKKKSSGKTKKPAPTGFEEFYADPPITPAEFEEERGIYDEDRPFPERIEACIQRYRARRKLDSIRNNILTKYFNLGGIESGAKTFNGGLDQDTLDNSTAAEIAAIQATDFIRTGNAKYYDPNQPEHWVVDWEGVAKGFLSWRAPRLFGDDETEIKLYCAVVRNFLNYVLRHEVCPEYTRDVMEARRICDLAEEEGKSMRILREILPGDFNVAASTAYGGYYKNRLIAHAAWANSENGENDWVSNVTCFSEPVSQFIVKAVTSLVGSREHFDRAMQADTISIAKSETRCFEVIGIKLASESKIDKFSNTKDPRGLGALKPVGKLLVKHWDGPGLGEEDLTDDEGVQGTADSLIEELWLENEILQHCYVGLKLDILLHELNIGVRYFDSFDVYPSFHLYLPSEKMLGWKEPIPNERPPPTEDDPDAEEKVMNAIIDSEVKEFEAK